MAVVSHKAWYLDLFCYSSILLRTLYPYMDFYVIAMRIMRNSSSHSTLQTIKYCKHLIMDETTIHPRWLIKILQSSLAIWFVFIVSIFSHTTQLFCSLHWLPVAAHNRLKKLRQLCLPTKTKMGQPPHTSKHLSHIALHHLPIWSCSPASDSATSQGTRGRYESRILLFWHLGSGMNIL